jgi:PAS domain S-box-containing protein
MSNSFGFYVEDGVRLQELQTELAELRAQNEELLWTVKDQEEQLWKYAGWFDWAPTAFIVHDQDGRVLSSNAAATTLFDVSQRDFGGSILNFVDVEETSALKAHFRLAQFSKSREYLELGLAARYGKFPVQLDTVAMPERNGCVLFLTAVTDLSRHKKTERTLRESEEKHRMLFEHSMDATFLTFSDGRIIAANPAACAMLGMTEEEICRAGRTGIVALEDRLVGSEERARAGKAEAVGAYRAKDGTLIPVEVESVVLPDETGRAFVIARDITAKVQAELALRQNEKRYRTLFEAIQKIVVLYELVTDSDDKPVDLRILDVNGFTVKKLGLTRDELLGHSLLELFPRTDRQLIDAAFEVAMTGEPAFLGECMSADGVWLRSHLASPQRNLVVQIALDITQIKQAELALQKSERTLAKAQHMAAIANWEWDIRSGAVCWSAEMYEILGVDSGKFSPTLPSFLSFVTAEDAPLVRHAIERSASQGEPLNIEFTIKRRDGSKRIIHGIGEVIGFDAAGKPCAMMGVNQDITVRKRMESALLQSRKLYKLLADTTPDLITMSDHRDRTTYTNDRWLDYTGLSRAEARSRRWSRLCHPEDLPELAETCAAASLAGIPYEAEFRYRRHDGVYCWFWRRAVPIKDKSGRVTGWVGVATDMTEQKRSHEALRQSEGRFRALLTASSDAIYRMSPDWREMWDLHSGGFLVDTKTVNANWFEEYIHPADQQHVLAAIQQAQTSRGVLEVEHRVLQSDGSFAWAFSRAVPSSDDSGELVEWFGTCKDITVSKRAQEALCESEERFRKIFEEGPLGAVIVGLDFYFVKTNRRFCDMTGYKSEELRILTFVDLTHPEDRTLTRSFPDLLLKGALGHYNLEKRYRHKTGAIIWVTVTAWLMRDAAGAASYYIAFVEDITEKKKLQQQLVVTAKRHERAKSLKTIFEYQKRLSQLASKLSIAQEEERRRIAVEVHDGIGQNLAYCKLKVGQLQRTAPALCGPLGEIMATIECCIRTSRSLSFELSPAVLFDIGLEPALQWLARLQADRHALPISVTADSNKELPLPLRILLFQAARELLANVVKHAGASHVEISLSETRKSVIIAVRDDGVGFIVPALGTFSESTSGFGLFNVQEQLHNAGGSLRIRSVPGAGTTAEASLPYK